jgi:ERCC4-type nuclease
MPPTLEELERRSRAAVARCFPGVGDELADNVSRQFSTVAEMVAASEKDWAAIKGIGKGKAKKIVRMIWGE